VKQTPCDRYQRLTVVYQSLFPTSAILTDLQAIVSGTMMLKLPKHSPTKVLFLTQSHPNHQTDVTSKRTNAKCNKNTQLFRWKESLAM